MKSLRHALLALALCLVMPVHAEVKLPASGDKSGWQKLTDLFAECSAVYNVASTLKAAPEKGSATYRELANNALIAGSYSAEQNGLGDSELESLYMQKFEQWNGIAKDQGQAAKILSKAELCLNDTLAIQNQLVDLLLNGQKATK